MTVYQLPQDFFKPSGKEPAGGVYVHPYESGSFTHKAKVSLGACLINFIQEGTKELHTGGHTTTVQPGQLVMIASGNCLMTERIAPSGLFCSLLLFYTGAAVESCSIRYPELFEQGNSTMPAPFLVLDSDAYLDHLVAGLRMLTAASLNHQEQLIRLKFEELVVYLVARHGAAVVPFFRPGPRQEKLLQFRSVVESNILSSYANEELAFMCHMSLSTFKRTFEQVYGTSPSRWYQQKRLELARQMLGQGSRPTEVYLKVGFETLSGFTKAFRQQYGVSPGKAEKPAY